MPRSPKPRAKTPKARASPYVAAPDAAALDAALGRARARWDRLRERLAAEHGATTEQWRKSTAQALPVLRLMRGDRAVVYLSPRDGSFLASMALGDAALAAARASDLPADIQSVLAAAPHYAEGNAVRIEVRSAADIDAIVRLAAFKLGARPA